MFQDTIHIFISIRNNMLVIIQNDIGKKNISSKKQEFHW